MPVPTLAELLATEANNFKIFSDNLKDNRLNKLAGEEGVKNYMLRSAAHTLASLFNCENRIPTALQSSDDIGKLAGVFSELTTLPIPTDPRKISEAEHALRTISKEREILDRARLEINKTLRVDVDPSAVVTDIEAIAIGVYTLFLPAINPKWFDIKDAKPSKAGSELLKRALDHLSETAVAITVCKQSQEGGLRYLLPQDKHYTNVSKGPKGWDLCEKRRIFEGVDPARVLVVEGVRIAAAVAAAERGFKVIFVTGGKTFNNSSPPKLVGYVREALRLRAQNPKTLKFVNSPADISFQR